MTVPTTPKNIGHVGTATQAAIAVGVYGHYAYELFATSPGLAVYDISDPTNPTNVAKLSAAGTYPTFHPFAFTGDWAYVAMHNDFYLLSITTPSAPQALADFAEVQPYGPSGVCLANGLVYLADQADGLRIFKLAGPRVSLTEAAGNLRLSWPSNLLNLVAQQSSDLALNGWVDLTNSPVLTNSTNQMFLSAPMRPSFYRLRLQ